MTPDEIQKDREAGTLDDLNERVNAFSTLSLPGQMPMMHMGTSYLVNDLWKAVRTLTAENAALKARVAELGAALAGMLSHSCVADAGADMKCEEDHTAERKARAALEKSHE